MKVYFQLDFHQNTEGVSAFLSIFFNHKSISAFQLQQITFETLRIKNKA